MLALRTIMFYLLLCCASFVFGVLSMVLWATPYHFRAQVLVSFNRVCLWGLKVFCGIRCEIKGIENIPKDTPAVIMAKHQSTWETFFLQLFFHPTSTILKQELLRIPFFGWGLAQMKPIAINRDDPRAALKKVKGVGKHRLEEGNNVLVFPEGTRTPVGQVGSYARSGADIALSSDAPLIPVAHNAGVYWPMHTWLKYPGTITLSIGEPIDTENKNSKLVTQEVKNWIEDQISQMPDKP